MTDTENITYENHETLTRGNLKPEQQQGALRGAQLLAKSLQAEGVTKLFGYPGGANLEIFHVLPEFGIECIRTEHEQGAIHAAQGYARASGNVGVCLATSGPGATNLVTGIADANSDSTAIVAITGNVPSHLLGKNAFQEVDIVAITRPVTKKSTLVTKVFEIPEIVREAFLLAGGNRPGPVLIDIPKDIQQLYPRDVEGNYREPTIPALIEPPEAAITGMDMQLEEACRLISESKRPVIYAGGGIVSGGCSDLLIKLAEHLRCPVTTTLMGHGVFPPGHELALDTLGMHGSKYANVAVNEADLVIALGVRFDDRVTGNVDKFIAHGKIIHIDIDRDELNKNKVVTLPVCADLAVAMQQLLKTLPSSQPDPEWLSYLSELKRSHPYPQPNVKGISPQFAIAALSEVTNGDAIVSLGVGQHQMWAMQHYKTRQPRSFLSSSGFGTMGYGLPAAMGAKVANPGRVVIDIDGDGSLNMTIHELACCYRFGIGVKVVVINNQWLGMVRQWQDMIYDKHRACTDLSDPKSADIYPNFLKIAEGYGIKSERVSSKDDLAAAYSRMLANNSEPYLLDIIVEAEENVYPMIPAGGSYQDIMMSDADRGADAKSQQGDGI